METALQLPHVINADGVRFRLVLRPMFLRDVGGFRDHAPVRADILDPELIEHQEIGVQIFPEKMLRSLFRRFRDRLREDVTREPLRDGEFSEVPPPREEVRMREFPLLKIKEKLSALSRVAREGKRECHLRYAMMPMKRARSTAMVSIFW
jgi:hypothetical protein